MKSTKLFEAIGGARDKYLVRSEKDRISSRVRIGWIACAACLCIAVICVALFRPQTPVEVIDPTPTVTEKPPKIDSAKIFSFDGMGYESYSAYDISQIRSGNPWTESKTPDTLPVFTNKSYNPYMTSYGLTEREMLTILYDVLDFFEIEIYDNTLTDIEKSYFTDSNRDPRGFLIPDDTVTRIVLTVEFGKIEVSADGTVYINFNKIPVIPEEYDIAGNPEETLLYCAEMFAGLLEFDEATVSVREYYNFNGEIAYEYKIYDGAGDITEQMLNYTLEYAQFYFDTDGNLSSLRIYNGLAVMDEIGSYPTISADRAKELLLDGTYYSSYIETDFPGEEYIARVELVYRGPYTESVCMPYYKFYVELPEREKEDGLKTYAAYYVPAIEPEYIASYPAADIEFTDKPVQYTPNAPTDFPELS